MDRKGVTSTNIASIGYDDEKCILEVEFKKGSVYQYHRVPRNVYDELMFAESKGKYLSQNVKPYYGCTTIE